MNTHRSQIRSLRICFFSLSICYLVYAPRIPDLKDRLQVSVSTLGAIFMIVGLMGMATSKLIAFMVKKLTSKRSILYALPLTLGGSVIIASAHVPSVFILGLVVLVFGAFLINTSINTQANALREITGSNQLSNLSAIANIGSLVGLLIGSIFLKIVDTPQYIIGVQAIVTIIFLISNRSLLDTDAHTNQEDTKHQKLPWFKRDLKQFWIIVLVMFMSTTAEFSVNDWSAILSRDDFKIGAPLYLAPFIVFQAGVIISRFALPRISNHFGEIRTVQISAISGAILWGASLQIAQNIFDSRTGLTISILLIGFFAAGCGTGPIWPSTLTSATKSKYPVPDVLARLFSILSAAFVFGPGIIGYLSKLFSLPVAMMVPVFGLLLAGVLAPKALKAGE